MLTPSKWRNLMTALALQIACVSMAHAFEQGSYFVFDIVDSPEVKPIDGRLAVPAKTLAIVESEVAITTDAKRSEFEIDFNHPIRPYSENETSFKFEPVVETTPEIETTSFGTETFGRGTSDTLFGE